MNHFSNPFNIGLWFVVIFFWAAVLLLARMNSRPISLRLLVIPAFFILLGMTINTYRMPWGTYMIALIHVLMLPRLFKIAKGNQ